MCYSRVKWIAAVCLLFLWNASSVDADDRFWIGGNADWVDGLGFGLWSPLSDEPDPDDVAIFNTNNTVDLGSNNTVMGLTLSNSIELYTADNFLDVNGDVSLSGSGTILGVGGNNVAGVPANGLDAEDITIANGTRLSLGDTRIDTNTAGEALIRIDSGGTLSGNGTLDNNDFAGAAFTMLRNNGTLSVSNFSTGLIIIGGTPAPQTLNITASDSDARIDLDGFLFSPFPTIVENGVVNVFRNQTLNVDVQLLDTFNSDINLFQESTLDIEDAWELGTGGLINVDNGFIPGSIIPFIPATPAGNATIAGGLLTQSGGTIDVVDSDGTLTFEADYTADGGTLDNSAGGTVVFQGTTSLNNAHDYALASNAQTIVDGGTTTVNDDNMDFDGSNNNADWTVTNGGTLNVFKSSINGTGSNTFSGDLVLDGGLVNVNVDGSSWTSNQEIRNDNGSGRLIGDRVLIGNNLGPANADVDVDDGTLTINAPVTFQGDANVNVAAGATLIVNSADTIFLPVGGTENGVFEGQGSFFVRGAQFDEDTTFNFQSGTVGLDGAVGNNSPFIILGNTAADTDINANVTINAGTFDDFGFTSFAIFPNLPTQSDLNISNSGRLTINLDNPNDSWTVLSNGIVNYNGDAVAGTFLSGSDINMDGTFNVNGDGRTTARLNVGGTINVNSVSGRLRLNTGGDTHAIAGGTINGPGELFTESNDDLSGFGSINAPVDFNGTSDLIASGGVLDVNGVIQDVHTLRSQAGATLDLGLVLDTNVTGNGISVEGGTVQGATITLSTRNLRGNGTVTNRLVNDNVIRALGSQLTINNSLSNYDGLGNTGELRAETGDLRIVDNASFGFQGTVRADVGQTVLADGFELQMNSTSTLDLNGGTFQSTVSTDFLGSIDTAAGQTSTISTPGSHFNPSASLQLNGDLEIVDDSLFSAGVSAVGGGRLIAANFGTMTLADGVDLDVFVENQTEVSVAGAGTGRADVDDYLQTAAGALLVGLETTTLGDYDRLIVSGNADLAGEISLNKVGAGTFDAYDPVSVLTASAGVIDTFDTVTGITDGMPAGQGFAVTYEANTVDVTRALLGDADLDMSVDVLGDAFTLVGNLGTLTGATWIDGDFNGDGAVDVLGDAFLLVGNLGQTFGGGPAPSTSSVPEPGTFSLVSLLTAAITCTRRRRC